MVPEKPEEEVMKENDKSKGYDIAHAYQQRNGERDKKGEELERRDGKGRERKRERETDIYFYIKCPDVTSSEGVRPCGSTLINKVTQR